MVVKLNGMIVQKLKKQVESEYVLAEKYYSILSALNNLKLTTRDIQLIAFTAIKGNISFMNHREEFCKTYGTTSPTINNIISKLKKKSILVKKDGKICVNGVISLDFSKDIGLQIVMTHVEK